MRWIPWIVFIVALVGAAGLILNTADQLPERVASHFGAGMQANGWMTRAFYVDFMLGFAVVLPAFVVATITVLPRFATRTVRLLASRRELQQRRDAMIAALGTHAPWLGCLLAAFIAGLHWTIVRANLLSPPRLPTDLFVGLMASFLVLLLLWIATLLVRTWRAR